MATIATGSRKKAFIDSQCLPPKIAQSLNDMVNREIILEDSSCSFWNVTLSDYKGMVAFCKGWHEFSEDMKLEIGDVLVFHYIKEGSFFFQAFGRDGCEKKYIPDKHPSFERAQKINANFTFDHEGEKNKQWCMDEECMLIKNQDHDDTQSDYNKCVFYDLPSFEMPQTARSIDITRKGSDEASVEKNLTGNFF
ncbi:hypothetical protein M9H77_24307 [Catharanthus roseus]|uniref:Uncharacterized protein n=1 Tax=Catharanthus roseus TaxID=4058 RepID=A0ACC0AWR1_CATRO|nr:hypothetical protein M9H77_24307 [Catharanthus roseus]